VLLPEQLSASTAFVTASQLPARPQRWQGPQLAALQQLESTQRPL
jgi:hypothetical protein